ncbi:MAG: hypothetical protein K0S53_505 [Bacteroidetes bacterium]|nr:hypothetical protein [Bacteroidota bacterium]
MVNAIHIGTIIKEELYQQNISVSDFARQINRSRNVIYDIFKRESIDTVLLYKIGTLLNCDFFSLYSAQKEFVHKNVKHFNAEGYRENNDPERFTAMVKQHQVLETENAYLKKIIALMEQSKDC